MVWYVKRKGRTKDSDFIESINLDNKKNPQDKWHIKE